MEIYIKHSVVYCIVLINNTYMRYSWGDSLETIGKWAHVEFNLHLLHRWAGIHARPAVPALNVNARGDATLTHAAPKGWMTRRLSQRLELSVSPCAKVHIKNAPFEKNKRIVR